MKFQNTSFIFFFERTDRQTNGQAEAICSPLFQSWGHKKYIIQREHMSNQAISSIPNGQLLQPNMSRVMRQPAFYICKNKDRDQLRGNREADQRLCFHYTDSTTPLLPKCKISSL